jgi:thiamine transport system substrate-binding protein
MQQQGPVTPAPGGIAPTSPSGEPAPRAMEAEPIVRRSPRRVQRMIATILVAGLVIAAGYGTYTYIATHPGRPVLVIYSYSSLLGGGCGQGNSTLYSKVFGAFGAAHGVDFEIECPASTLSTTLIDQANAPVADLAIGLDEVTAPQAEAAHVLLPYRSPALADISPSVAAELSSDHAVTPYEWGYLGIDYCPAFANETHGAIATSAFPEFATNASWAQNLIVEAPTDIVGEEFLLWEIAFETQVLHTDWRGWWSAVAPKIVMADSWDTAFGLFTCAPHAPQEVVSFLADPAYAAYYGTFPLGSTVSHWPEQANGTSYGWRATYGIGIVNGTRNLALDEEFVNWFLSPTVQSLLPTAEWEYPANTTVPVPPVFGAAIDPGTITPLNDDLPPATIAANLSMWLSEWQSTVNAAG